jgi:hypothetical protein
MAFRRIPYFHPMYFPLELVEQRQTRVGAPSREETNQVSAWPCPKGTLVPLNINGSVSLVTLERVFLMLPEAV